MITLADIDQPDYLVHGSYLDNLTRILKAGGLFPPKMLSEDAQPLVVNRRRKAAEMAARPVGYRPDFPSLATTPLHDVYECSLVSGNFNHVYHFFMVSNFPYKTEGGVSIEHMADENEPAFENARGDHVFLFNQGLLLDTMVGIVIPTDSRLQQSHKDLSRSHWPNTFLSYRGGRKHVLTTLEIAERVHEKLERYNQKIPIFDFSGAQYFT